MNRRRPVCLLVAGVLALAGPSAPALAQAEEGGAVPPRLAGLDEAGVRRELGEPSLARAEGAGAFWTYRLPRCALFVYFGDDGRGLRVTGASSGPRRHGEPVPDLQACLAQEPGPTPAAPPAPR